MLALKISAILASTYMVAAMPTDPVPAATKCGMLNFEWKGPNGIECLPLFGNLVHASPPNGVKCPNGYYYRAQGYCTPRFPSNDQPDCDDKHFKWNEATFTCTVGTTSAPVGGN